MCIRDRLTLVSHEKLAGIALQSGGVTSHAAILARAFEIPTVVGIDHLMESIVERDYVGLSKRYEAFKKELIEEGDGPTATRDGHRVMMLANIALLPDIHLALR